MVDQLTRQQATTDPAGGFLSTGTIIILIGILLLFMIGVAWPAIQWLSSAQSI